MRDFDYDNDQQLTAENWMQGSTVIASMAYGYDLAGQPTSASDANSAYAFTYDGDGNVTLPCIELAVKPLSANEIPPFPDVLAQSPGVQGFPARRDSGFSGFIPACVNLHFAFCILHFAICFRRLSKLHSLVMAFSSCFQARRRCKTLVKNTSILSARYCVSSARDTACGQRATHQLLLIQALSGQSRGQ